MADDKYGQIWPKAYAYVVDRVLTYQHGGYTLSYMVVHSTQGTNHNVLQMYHTVSKQRMILYSAMWFGTQPGTVVRINR